MLDAKGKVTNNDTVKHSFFVTVTLLNKNGDIMGAANGAVNDLPPKATKTY